MCSTLSEKSASREPEEGYVIHSGTGEHETGHTAQYAEKNLALGMVEKGM